MLSFQHLILRLQEYWDRHGCALLQPYDMEVGAGTFHTATFLRAIGPEPWRAAYVQPSRRPKDGRYGDNPNRLQHYYQYQVVLKPSPPDILELYLGSLRALGIDTTRNDVRFVEDDWGYRRIDRLWGDATVAHRPHARAQGRWRARRWQCGWCRHRLPCRRAGAGRSPARPNRTATGE